MMVYTNEQVREAAHYDGLGRLLDSVRAEYIVDTRLRMLWEAAGNSMVDIDEYLEEDAKR